MIIRERRIKADMTQEQLAAALKINRATVTMWETGKSSPRAEMLPAIARLLECKIDDLYGKEDG